MKESLSALSKLMWNAFYAYTAPARAPCRQIKRTLQGCAELSKKPATHAGTPLAPSIQNAIQAQITPP